MPPSADIQVLIDFSKDHWVYRLTVCDSQRNYFIGYVRKTFFQISLMTLWKISFVWDSDLVSVLMVQSIDWELSFLEGEVRITVVFYQPLKIFNNKTWYHWLPFHYPVPDLSLTSEGNLMRVFLNFGMSCRYLI